MSRQALLSRRWILKAAALAASPLRLACAANRYYGQTRAVYGLVGQHALARRSNARMQAPDPRYFCRNGVRRADATRPDGREIRARDALLFRRARTRTRRRTRPSTRNARDLMVPVLGACKTSKLIEMINHLETLKDIRGLRLLTTA